MVRLGYLIIFAVVAFAFLIGCSKNQRAVTVGLGEVFTVGVGQTARIAGEDMEVTLIEVVGDSRCPQNATCVWEGVASTHIKITHQGSDYSIVLNQPGLTEQAKETFAYYTLIYRLDPYPREGEGISPKDYRLTLTATK
jgi:hypothetical protein